MSWQADIKKLHEKASRLGVDLTEFQDELNNDEGWYTESNIQELIECLLSDIEIKSEMYEMLQACSEILKKCDLHNTSRDVDEFLAKARGEK